MSPTVVGKPNEIEGFRLICPRERIDGRRTRENAVNVY